MKIKICITSNKNFSHNTLPILLPSLKDSGIENEDILIVEGGFDERTVDIVDGMTHIKTNQNSIEYTCLIEIVEHQIESDYWFMMHDTCRVGSKFKELMYNIPINADKVALKTWPSMTIGAYKYEYLLNHKKRLMDIKNTDYSREKLQYWKQWGIHNEDYMLWRENQTPCHVYNPHLEHKDKFVVCDEPQWYKDSKTIRRVEYYPQLDLYKNKANWEPKPWMEIDV